MVKSVESCAAFGCYKLKVKGQIFCKQCFAKLSPALQGPAAARDAVVHLARADGYLVDAPPRHRAQITDHKGTEDA
jgi:hypothetical protein